MKRRREDGYSSALDATEIKRRQDERADRRNRAIIRDGIKEELRRKDEVVHGKADAGSLYQQFTQSHADKEKMRREEKEKLAAEAAEAARARKLFVCGDALGGFARLFSVVEAQNKKVGPFDAMFCAGSFLPSDATGVDAGTAAYLRGEKELPLDCYFVDPGAVLLQAAPKGKSICKNLNFLGAYGVRELHGLRVAYLSGHYDPATYNSDKADFVGGSFTARAVDELCRLVTRDKKQRGIDVLLTCGWPAACGEQIVDASLRPPEIAGQRGWEEFASPALEKLCLAIEPRYHVFGSANVFYQRPPFMAPRRKHACRCLGLGTVSSGGSANKQQKWLHALNITPMAHMKREDLVQVPPATTPCPFKEATESTSSCTATAPQAQADNESVLQNALSAVLSGDLSAYFQAAEQLRSSPFSLRAAAGAASEQPGGGEEAQPARSALEVPDDPKKKAAEKWLKAEPPQGVVRFTFNDTGPLGLRLSKDVPPWVLEVKDGLAARKAPRVPLGGIVLAINGHDLRHEDNSKALALRPVVLDIQWPHDQLQPNQKYA